MTRLQRTTAAALATCGAAALALTVVPASADATEPQSLGWNVRAGDVPGQRADSAAQPGQNAHKEAQARAETVRAELAERRADSERVAVVDAANAAAAERQAQEAVAQAERLAAEARAAEEAEQAAAEQAAAEAEAEAAAEAASEPAVEPVSEPVAAPAAEPTATTYADNLDGWIREALDIMAQHGIPGSYDGLYRNIMRESSGNPSAVNDWDINAINGTPSIGLLQVIQPTFDAYHVEGTPYDLYDPVANIVAAANYAWDRYGSIDNVNGPY
ncbi:transglycosylase SLT domain-containing protein [Streptomyces hainanensis]|uniref:Lytic transglycosylase n=1 Tax=Streptomyces hainanensis TaxID=402648 RepID=A0A4R4T0D3_9ACTN|nr:transglycosylase SLT domain-containing protein [Streptomyces hainanensis]TDC69076.1 lytic transglycosylase [Streptomyces hainanensis]